MSLDTVGPGALIHVTERDDVARSRRAAHELAIADGVDGRRMSELALVVTVVATNLVLHGGGLLSLRRLGTLGGPGLEVLAYLDAGSRPWLHPGRRPGESFGAGLSALRRLSDEYAVAEQGSLLWARLGRSARRTRLGHAAGTDPAAVPRQAPYVTGVVAPTPSGTDVVTQWRAVHRPGRVTLVACHAGGPPAEEVARRLMALASRSGRATSLAGYREILGAAPRAGASFIELDLQRRTVTAGSNGSLAVRITADGQPTRLTPSDVPAPEVRVRWAHTVETLIHPESLRGRLAGGAEPAGQGGQPHHPALRAAALLRGREGEAEPSGLVVVARVDEDALASTAAQG
ncbi:hypothetical protein ACJ5H2_03470 [Nocardioides sp. R1-1]|uniref:hypothetical protein n=1 Tax=Nocardioides sp. R1-1 TaxID=3383502 RepID=UPI0038CFDEED